MILHAAGYRRGIVCAPHSVCGRGRPRHPGRRRQCHRGHDRHGREHRRGLSAHEPYRRRRLLADPRAVGPRARADGRRAAPAPRQRRGFIAMPVTTRSRRAGRSPRSPCRARWRAGYSRSRPPRRNGGKLPLDVLLERRHQARPRRLHGDAQPGTADGREIRRAGNRAGLHRRRFSSTASRRRPAPNSSRAPSPRRSINSPTRGSTISIAAMSAARSPPTWSASAAR